MTNSHPAMRGKIPGFMHAVGASTSSARTAGIMRNYSAQSLLESIVELPHVRDEEQIEVRIPT